MSAHRYHLSTKKADKKKPQPMARAVKQKKDPKEFLKNIHGTSSVISSLLRKNLIGGVGIILLLTLLIVVFFTPLLLIKEFSYDLQDAHGCMTESNLKEELKKKRTYPWSYMFFDSAKLREKYTCLLGIQISWSPVKFYEMHVRVVGQEPVMKVIATKVESVDAVSGSDAYYSSGIAEESMRYVTKDGALITLSEQPGMFTIRYRVPKDIALDSIQISSEDIRKLFQLNEYLHKEYGVQVQPDVTSLGSVKIQLPFAEDVYLTLRDDLTAQLGSLQAVLSTSTINKAKIKSIDLRYGNPVIRYN